MKKKFFLLILSFGLIYTCIIPAFSAEKDEAENFYYTCFVKKNLTKEANQLNVFLANYFKVFEQQDVKELNGLYAFNYKSSDSFNKEQMLKLIKELKFNEL